MANKKFLLGILVMALVFGMTVIGCGNGTTNTDNENGDDGETTVVSGTTWRLDELHAATLSFSNSTYTAKLGETVTDSGTYTVSENIINCVGGDEDLATMTIIDKNTLQDGKGSRWTKVN